MASEYHGYPQGVPAPIVDGGIDLLRRLRGDERISFTELAHRMIDYAKSHPGAFSAIDAFARYLAELEQAGEAADA